MSTTDDEGIRTQAAHFVIRMGESPHALSSAERDELERFPEWARDSRNGQEFHALSTIAAMLGDQPAADQARLQAESEVPTSERASSRRQVVQWWAFAASVLVVLVLAGFYAQSRHLFGGESFITQTGEKRTVTFQEGSVAYLNTRTELRWIGNERDRRVELIEGEALFDVVHDEANAFRVVLGNSEIRVLGTRFDVYRKPNGDTRVTVLEGTVEVHGLGDAAWTRTLNVNEQLAYGAVGLVSEPHFTDAENAVGWRKGYYKFADEPIGRVVEELMRYTDRRIVIRDPRVAEHHMGGALDVRNVNATLHNLEKYAPVQVTENNDTFMLDYRATPEQRKD
jgi:transmembrane sensor